MSHHLLELHYQERAGSAKHLDSCSTTTGRYVHSASSSEQKWWKQVIPSVAHADDIVVMASQQTFEHMILDLTEGFRDICA